MPKMMTEVQDEGSTKLPSEKDSVGKALANGAEDKDPQLFGDPDAEDKEDEEEAADEDTDESEGDGDEDDGEEDADDDGESDDDDEDGDADEEVDEDGEEDEDEEEDEESADDIDDDDEDETDRLATLRSKDGEKLSEKKVLAELDRLQNQYNNVEHHAKRGYAVSKLLETDPEFAQSYWDAAARQGVKDIPEKYRRKKQKMDPAELDKKVKELRAQGKEAEAMKLVIAEEYGDKLSSADELRAEQEKKEEERRIQEAKIARAQDLMGQVQRACKKYPHLMRWHPKKGLIYRNEKFAKLITKRAKLYSQDTKIITVVEDTIARMKAFKKSEKPGEKKASGEALRKATPSIAPAKRKPPKGQFALKTMVQYE